MSNEYGTLSVTTRDGEEVYIGETIAVSWTRRDDGSIRIRITAPKSVPILRAKAVNRRLEPRRPQS